MSWKRRVVSSRRVVAVLTARVTCSCSMVPEVPTPFSTPAVTCATSDWNRDAASSSLLRVFSTEVFISALRVSVEPPIRSSRLLVVWPMMLSNSMAVSLRRVLAVFSNWSTRTST